MFDYFISWHCGKSSYKNINDEIKEWNKILIYVIIYLDLRGGNMFEMLQNNDLIITNNKNKILKYLNDEKKLLSLKIMGLEEFKNRYFGMYKKEAIYYLIKKYNYKYEVSLMYLDNLYHLNDLKQELEQNNLVKTEPLFKESFKRIIIDNIKVDNYMLKELSNREIILI